MSNPTGRPTDYTEELADLFCERISIGRSMRSICSDTDMPVRTTIFRWLRTYDVFKDQYKLAKIEGVESRVDEMMDIADDSTNDYMERLSKEGETTLAMNPESVQRSRLRVDARKWYASKIVPKLYGDRLITDNTIKSDTDGMNEQELTQLIMTLQQQLETSDKI